MARLLNLGCGRRTHPAWVNVDHLPLRPGVQRVDLRRPLPFAGASFDAVYASHVLEHLEPAEGSFLLAEMRRVLRPGGIARLVVPDLERSARGYLEALEGEDEGRYDWALVELLDQLVRTRSGGEMSRLVAHASPTLRAHIEDRVGDELFAETVSARPPWRDLLALALSWLRGGPAAVYRASGEAHRWMYDRRSLSRALLAAGLDEPRQVNFDQSAIAGFAAFDLDGERGKNRKPDSLFMEAICP